MNKILILLPLLFSLSSSKTYEDCFSLSDLKTCSSLTSSIIGTKTRNNCHTHNSQCCCTLVNTPKLPGKDKSFCELTYKTKNSSWLPEAYSSNAFFACSSLPENDPQARCIRQFLALRLDDFGRYPQKMRDVLKETGLVHKEKRDFIDKIYVDHVDAYEECGCNGKPAPYVTWVGVVSQKLFFKSLIETAIKVFGSCENGYW